MRAVRYIQKRLGDVSKTKRKSSSETVFRRKTGQYIYKQDMRQRLEEGVGYGESWKRLAGCLYRLRYVVEVKAQPPR